MPGMDWLDADMLGAIVAGMALIGGAIKWIDARQERRQREQHEQLTQMAAMLARADHQLHPNSGKSLADSVNRIEERVGRIADDLGRERQDRSDDDTTLRGELDRFKAMADREHKALRDQIDSALRAVGEVD